MHSVLRRSLLYGITAHLRVGRLWGLPGDTSSNHSGESGSPNHERRHSDKSQTKLVWTRDEKCPDILGKRRNGGKEKDELFLYKKYGHLMEK